MAVFHNLALEALPATDLNPRKAPDAPQVLLNKEFGDDCDVHTDKAQSLNTSMTLWSLHLKEV
jgi:hypothetical protein